MPQDDVLIVRMEDTLPILTLQLLDESGAAVSLDSGTDAAQLKVQLSGADPDDPLVVDAAMTITDGAQGIVTYQWDSADTDTKGVYDFWVVVTFGDGTIQSFPQGGTFTLVVEDGTVMSTDVMRLRAKAGDRYADVEVPFFTNYELQAILDEVGGDLDRAAYECWSIKTAAYSEFYDIEESGSGRRISQKFRQAREMLSVYEKKAWDRVAATRVVGVPMSLDESGDDPLDGGYISLPRASDYIRRYPLYRMRAIYGGVVQQT